MKHEIYSVELVMEIKTITIGTFKKESKAKELLNLCERLMPNFSNEIKGVILVGWNSTEQKTLFEITRG